MTMVKARAADMKRLNAPAARYAPPGGWKDRTTPSVTKEHSGKVLEIRRAADHSIHRFHLAEPKWNNHQCPDKGLSKVTPIGLT